MSTELVLLGTAGGPTPRGERHGPSQVVLVDDDAYVIDCGSGVARQLFRAGVPISSVRAVFITHHHSDHNADLGNLFLLSWAGLRRPVDIYGPPPLSRIMKSFFEMSRYDTEIRSRDEKRPPLESFIRMHEFTGPGTVYKDERVRVSAAPVEHPPVEECYAFRLDTDDRAIVISGDTRACEAVVGLATGADVLVHEALYVPGVEQLVAGNNARAMREHVMNSHTSVSEVGGIAERAGVPELVLSHLAPSSNLVSDEIWESEAQKGYSGKVLPGEDLMRL